MASWFIGWSRLWLPGMRTAKGRLGISSPGRLTIRRPIPPRTIERLPGCCGLPETENAMIGLCLGVAALAVNVVILALHVRVARRRRRDCVDLDQARRFVASIDSFCRDWCSNILRPAATIDTRPASRGNEIQIGGRVERGQTRATMMTTRTTACGMSLSSCRRFTAHAAIRWTWTPFAASAKRTAPGPSVPGV